MDVVLLELLLKWTDYQDMSYCKFFHHCGDLESKKRKRTSEQGVRDWQVTTCSAFIHNKSVPQIIFFSRPWNIFTAAREQVSEWISYVVMFTSELFGVTRDDSFGAIVVLHKGLTWLRLGYIVCFILPLSKSRSTQPNPNSESNLTLYRESCRLRKACS
jgi:hypothetical protein